MDNTLRDYLTPSELCPSNTQYGESVRLAVHALQLNPNAIWARLRLLVYTFGSDCLDYNGGVLDMTNGGAMLKETANRAAMAMCGASLARGIHKYDRYEEPLKKFVWKIYNNSRRTVREIYAKEIGSKEIDPMKKSVDEEFNKRFQKESIRKGMFKNADFYDVIVEMFGVCDGKPKEIKSGRKELENLYTINEWKALLLSYDLDSKTKGSLIEIISEAQAEFEESSKHSPGQEYREFSNNDANDAADSDRVWSINTSKTEKAKSVLSSHENDYANIVNTVQTITIPQTIIAGGEKKEKGKRIKLKHLQYSMSISELERALRALEEKNTRQLTDDLPSFNEYKEFYFAHSKWSTPRFRIANHVNIEIARICTWEGIDNKDEILNIVGVDYPKKIAEEIGEDVKYAKTLSAEKVRGIRDQNHYPMFTMFNEFMNSRMNNK